MRHFEDRVQRYRYKTRAVDPAVCRRRYRVKSVEQSPESFWTSQTTSPFRWLGGKGRGLESHTRLARFQVSEATKEATSRMIDGQIQSKYYYHMNKEYRLRPVDIRNERESLSKSVG